MVAWRAVLDSEPDFARRAQMIMDAHRHKMIATLRADGSPRISGIEASFVQGQLWFGSMPARPRPAAGSAVRAAQRLGGPSRRPGVLFRADIDEVVITRVGEPADHLVIELWRPDRPLHRIQRH